MRVQEVTQRRDELPSMRNIVAPNRHADVVDQYVSDLFGAVLSPEQGKAKHGGDGIRNMLVLGDGVNLFRCEVREPDHVFKRDHGCLHLSGLTEAMAPRLGPPDLVTLIIFNLARAGAM